uniref:Embryonal Fyn-associated substrate n=1 Tax=Ornithorhynchus anatinus TaxID=9258 RepID=A0A6I8PCK1_ORNAN
SPVYVVPPPARPCSALGPPPGPCPPSPETIYKVPRDPAGDATLEVRDEEVYDIPPSALRGPASGPYDAPAPFSRPLARVAPQTPSGEDAPYDVPPALKPPPEPDLELEGGREPGPPVYASPSNLKRASALLNLYEAPEELLGEATGSEDGIYDVPVLGPEEPPAPALPPPPSPSDLETLTLLLARSPPPPPRPRLPSAESLSRRPLPALPVSEPAAPSPAPSPASGRKGSIQDRPLPPPPPRLPSYGGPKADGDGERREGEGGAGAAASNEYEGIQLGEEYDYVHLKVSCPPVDPSLSEAFSPGEPLALPAGDLQLLHFYAGQCRGHYAALRAAVAALLASAHANQPPRLFVPHGKRVVVAAHRLVFVGDTLGRLAASALRATVLAVKGAALGYPSGPAARELAQCVAELADRARHFTGLLGGLAG